MSIEIIKEEFRFEEARGKAEDQVLVELEVFLNSFQEEVKEIAWIDGKLEISNTMIIKDKILINGLVKYNIVYKSPQEEANLYSHRELKEFSEELPIQGIREDMHTDLSADIDYLEYELGENKLEIKTLINIASQVKEVKTIETIKDISGGENLEVLKDKILYEKIYGHEESLTDIREIIPLGEDKSSIERVLSFSLEAIEKESTALDDRLIVSGLVGINLIYLADDNDIYAIKDEIPFNHFLEIPGLDETAKADVSLDIVEASYDAMEDESGELRLVDIDLKLKIRGIVFYEDKKELIIDAYSTREDIDVEREEINIPESLESLRHEEELKLDAGINAMEILDIKEVHRILEERITEEGVVIEGSLDLSVYYIDRISGELSKYFQTYPYKTIVAYDGSGEDLILDVKSRLNPMDYSLKRDNLQIERNIQYDIQIKRERKLYCIKSLEETGILIDKRLKPSITVYIVQKGDVLWDIARRYNTTGEEILRSNGLDRDYRLEVGDKIIIEKNLQGDL